MKSSFLILASVAAATCFARADDVALLTLRVGKEKAREKVAIELHESDAPATVRNFKELAQDKFYKGIAVHRSIPHSLVQMGDPLSRKKERLRVGTGGPGYTVPAEIRRKHVAGAVAASRLPDKLNPSRVSNGSQFYICLTPMPNLDGQYTVFGQVIYGMEALDRISMLPVDSNDFPVQRVEIESVQILPREQLPSPPPPQTPAPAPSGRRWWQIFG
jgi:cyclophilin family peptidyl-prolyl cis-trans isomerase